MYVHGSNAMHAERVCSMHTCMIRSKASRFLNMRSFRRADGKHSGEHTIATSGGHGEDECGLALYVCDNERKCGS